MKIIKVIAISLLLIFIVLFIGVFIFLKTFDFNRFKPQIVSAAQNALGRTVDFSRIGLDLGLTGIQLKLSGIVVGEDSAFGEDNFLSVKEIKLGVSLPKLIFKRQVQILGVECKSPRINIIRLKDGRINAQALVSSASQKQGTVETSKTESSESVGQVGAGLPVIMIDKINVDDASISYVDYSFEPKVTVTLDKIFLNIQNFSLKDAFPIILRASLLSNIQNISAKAFGKIDLEHSSFLLTDLKSGLALNSLSKEKLYSSIPQLKNVPLKEFKSGDLSVSIDSLVAGPKGLIALKSQGLLTIGNGKAEFSGEIKEDLPDQNYSVKVTAINIADLIDQSAYPVKINGLIFSDFNIKNQTANLAGSGKVEIIEGKLIDINVLRTVLDKLALVPNLAVALEEKMPERYKESLNSKDTVITNCNAALEITGDGVQIKSINTETQAFKFQGNGVVGFNQEYSFSGAFEIFKDLSSVMVEAVPEMGYLLDDSSQISFPLTVLGKGASVSFRPDIKQMGITAIKNRGRQELEKVLDKALGREKNSQQEQDTGAEEEKTGKQELIESIIGSVFGNGEKE